MKHLRELRAVCACAVLLFSSVSQLQTADASPHDRDVANEAIDKATILGALAAARETAGAFVVRYAVITPGPGGADGDRQRVEHVAGYDATRLYHEQGGAEADGRLPSKLYYDGTNTTRVLIDDLEGGTDVSLAEIFPGKARDRVNFGYGTVVLSSWYFSGVYPIEEVFAAHDVGDGQGTMSMRYAEHDGRSCIAVDFAFDQANGQGYTAVIYLDLERNLLPIFRSMQHLEGGEPLPGGLEETTVEEAQEIGETGIWFPTRVIRREGEALVPYQTIEITEIEAGVEALESVVGSVITPPAIVIDEVEGVRYRVSPKGRKIVDTRTFDDTIADEILQEYKSADAVLAGAVPDRVRVDAAPSPTGRALLWGGAGAMVLAGGAFVVVRTARGRTQDGV